MSFNKILLFIILVCYTIGGDSCNPNSQHSEKCEFINRDFNSMKGYWLLEAGKSSGSTSSSQHKYLYVYSINQNGFESQMEFKTNTGTQMKYPIKGEYHNETTVKLTGWSDEPQYAEIQVCNDNKFLRIKLQELDDILILTHEARLIVDVNINAGQLKMEYVP
ncbi:hypothetical protein PV326_006490 [Microctonus aethiopoides]|uniref:Lipocalin-like domain-containing protein n=1 Tax=Microctonus aethiopoides TaxID=144406 RepID=A0AA39FA17_9HYME|nr:hypothetical protein PV326_006490 [Microctonus aethiopoides]KAK0165722.1 hypothetical protein PV328_004221 [Microctonus aethiopoides]